MFGKLKKAKNSIKESWGVARGDLLVKGLEDTLLNIHNAEPRLVLAIIRHVEDIYCPIANGLWNMTVEGQIQKGRDLQNEARNIVDGDVSKGYALWIVGAWMESRHCPGDAAAYVYSQLTELLQNTAQDAGQYDLIKMFDQNISLQDSSINKDSDKYFSIVAGELERNEMDKGLWLKAYTLANADENIQKVIYTRLRVQDLKEEGNKRKAKEVIKIAEDKRERERKEKKEEELVLRNANRARKISEKGLIVTAIRAPELAAKIDIKIGDVIVSYSGEDVRDNKELFEELEKGMIDQSKDTVIRFVSADDVLEKIAPMGMLGVVVAQLV